MRIFRAYATGSDMIPKEFPEMFEKLQEIGVNIWLPGGPRGWGRCSFGRVRQSQASPRQSQVCEKVCMRHVSVEQDFIPATVARWGETRREKKYGPRLRFQPWV